MNIDFLKKMRLYELEQTINLIREESDRVIILEIGAGAGWQSKRLTEEKLSVKAIDIDDSMYSKNQIYPVVNYDGKHIPFSDNYFDVVFSSNVLEHIPHLYEFQQEIKRVLKPGGIAIHIVPSGSWRFWSYITHYPHKLKAVLEVVSSKILNKKRESEEVVKFNSQSKKELFKRALFPHRHGERGNAITEMAYFSRRGWEHFFRKSDWEIKHSLSNNLFYSEHVLLGSLLSIRLRAFLSHFLGSSCFIFVLRDISPSD